MTKKNKQLHQQDPVWKKKGFESSSEYAGWLYFNNLVHSSDGNEHVSVDDNNEAVQLFKENE